MMSGALVGGRGRDAMAVDGWNAMGSAWLLLRGMYVLGIRWVGAYLSIGFNWGSGWGRWQSCEKRCGGPTFGPHRDYNFAAGAKFLELFFSFLLQIKKYDTKLPRPPLVSHGARLPDLK
jgi:hypothetical protein